MYILHGTWIPDDEVDRFYRSGQFYLWVETDQSVKRRTSGQHPNHLKRAELANFLSESLGIKPPIASSYVRRKTNSTLDPEIVSCAFVLPTVNNAPLPSWEMAQYLEIEVPEKVEWQSWQVDCYPVLLALNHFQKVRNVVKFLHDLYFLTQYRLIDVQMGTDLLFWYHYTQRLKQIILRDQYIPAFKYRSTTPPPTGRKRKTPIPETFEIYAGWEIVSEEYENMVQSLSEEMPAFCRSGFITAPDKPQFYDAQLLLRQFSEVLLMDIVVHTARSNILDKKISDTILQSCLKKDSFNTFWDSEDGLNLYTQWRGWRDRINQSQTPGSFILAFQLCEPKKPDAEWELAIQVAPKSDPSQRLDLKTYWRSNLKKQKSLGLGDDFEQVLLLNLGYAARIYPKLWEGLETDQPCEVLLSLAQAFEFLEESAWVLEDAGYRVIVPAWWTPKGRAKAKVKLRPRMSKKSAAAESSGYFSASSLASYDYEFAIGEESVTQAEWEQLIENKSPLVQFRGQWMAIDSSKMKQMLEFWKKQRETQPDLTLLDMMKLSAGSDDDVELVVDHDQTLVEMMQRLGDKSSFEEVPDPALFQGQLRPYQRRGVGWLTYLEMLGMSACLADDMGMGKSAQVIARLVHERETVNSVQSTTTQKTNKTNKTNKTTTAKTTTAKTTKAKAIDKTSISKTVNAETITNVLPTLLIAPTSVIGNWGKEIEKFAPHLKYFLHHGSDRINDAKEFKSAVQACDVVITSYTMVRMDEALISSQQWQRIVIDEAQNIKNPKAAQTKAILKLEATHRLALTGTPVENRLLDLWSIFNFLNPGYLGKEAQFRNAFEIPIQRDNNVVKSATLRKLVEPFILRRVKTDPAIIQDLPDKVEQKCYCNLTKEQAALYEVVVKEVSKTIETVDGIQRKGMILATLMKLKQICNHPAQFLQDNSDFEASRSQKLDRILTMIEEAMAENESLLVFTQFTEIGEALEKILRQRHFNTYYLHGGTARKKREQMITEFQDPETPPSIFILSLKAGGVGITLTKANHVFHFDRWWNPAVEDQATDRAFRIGQTKNVFVHKFIALGTLEEKIDQMIEDKKKLAGAIVGSDESWLSTLDNNAFKQLIALNRKAVAD
jgi:SNF2 family DNA or RNA helicase